MSPSEPTPAQQIEQLFPIQSRHSGWTAAMGMSFITLSHDEVVLEWTVGPEHLQPFGLVHGGVYCGAIETVCSVGALLAAGPGTDVVGTENQTSFLRPVRSGVLTARGVPVHVGRRSQLWEARVTDTEDRVVAVGRLRVFCMPRKGQ